MSGPGKQITMTGAELSALVPQGDVPDTITVQGIVFTMEQIDKISHTFQSHLPLTIQRLRNGRLAVASGLMPAGVWSLYEADGRFELSPSIPV